MLFLNNITVVLGSGSEIIRNFSLKVSPGEVHALMGPNGSGKSTLALTIAGHPLYQVKKGNILFQEQEVSLWSVTERAQRGIFVSFQQPPVLSGVSVFSFLKEAVQAVKKEIVDSALFHERLVKAMECLALHPLLMYRDVNEGFSGGERKKLEIVQLCLLEPSCIILDEVDSGLDVDALVSVAQALDDFKKTHPLTSIIIITHRERILRLLQPDCVHVMKDGSLVQSGTYALAELVEESGYDGFTEEKKG
ncbi:MAG: Fe-S cluster assembly ATPase SufC [Candidatus Babeliales bacterium]